MHAVVCACAGMRYEVVCACELLRCVHQVLEESGQWE